MKDCSFCGRGYEGDLCPRCDDAVDVVKVLGVLGPRKSGLPPREMGRFRVVRPLGEGGTGIVYEAMDPVLGRSVALKLLKSHGVSPEVVERFLREARFLAKLRHPNVVQVYELGKHEGRDFLAMEFIEGKPFPATADRKEAVARLARVARALGHIHRRSIVHRDLKPNNILVDGGGRPVVMDFGIARSAETVSTLSLEGTLVGTPAYMAPEQFAGETADARADVYALGVILYEVLAGRRPYDGRTVVALAEQVRAGKAAPIPGVPRELEAVCRKAMAVEPEERYATADALADALEGRTAAPRRPRRLFWALGGAAAGLLILAAAFALRPKPIEAPKEVVAAAPQPDFLKAGLECSARASFEEAHAAFDRALEARPGDVDVLLAKGQATLTQQFALHADRLNFPETMKALGARLAARLGTSFDRLASRPGAFGLWAATYARIARADWAGAKAALDKLPAAEEVEYTRLALGFFLEERRLGPALRAAIQKSEGAAALTAGERDLWLTYARVHELKALLARVPGVSPSQRNPRHAGLLRLEGLLLEARGEKTKALEVYGRALKEAPDFLPARLARLRLLRLTQGDLGADLQAARAQAQAWQLPLDEIDPR